MTVICPSAPLESDILVLYKVGYYYYYAGERQETRSTQALMTVDVAVYLLDKRSSILYQT